MKSLQKYWLAILSVACLVACGAVWAARDAAATPIDLAAWVPQGALLSLETQDFAKLLEGWTSSAEKSAWMKSDDYALFSRSRLFGRLQGAQKDFADAAGLPVDSDLLKDMAGRQSFFAWYDIGGLQIVYMTRLTPVQLQQSRLWQQRKKFETRQAGSVTFYVKTGRASKHTAAASDANVPSDEPSADSDVGADDGYQGESRTVAFAETGEWLVLATGEDLMAQTLERMAAKDHAGDTSLAQQGWYRDARAATTGPEGDLRMVLDMERVVRTPQFRTYWIQQNVTEMKQYRAVVADIYRDAEAIREERVLIPEPDTAVVADVDLGQMAALVPDHTVIYRASVRPTAAEALTALETKVLHRGIGTYEDATLAPIAALDTPQAGSMDDLETRIDEPVAAPAEKPHALPLLAKLLQEASLNSMMTVDRNSTDGKADGIWTPFASAVVLSSDREWDQQAIKDAVQQMVRTRLTVGSLGVVWQQKIAHGVTYWATSDVHGLQLSISGHLCILADDAGLLTEILEKQQAKTATAQPAIMLAEFDHAAAQASFAQWTSVVDRPPNQVGVQTVVPTDSGADAQNPGEDPSFFGKDMKGLSDAFASLRQEHFSARHDGTLVRQTVTYLWQR